ncbi:hypothetical protein DSO57_1018379 [Entomophthora muscae]|uniref:Uncharacterized protein n=1 Tax=Entomophthora muscae TaxID=34485 RepID=A0ACC2T4N8_9FUNG|nr:hypothetical protein DSO57_1018379 [Entomophthora muscae]
MSEEAKLCKYGLVVAIVNLIASVGAVILGGVLFFQQQNDEGIHFMIGGAVASLANSLGVYVSYKHMVHLVKAYVWWLLVATLAGPIYVIIYNVNDKGEEFKHTFKIVLSIGLFDVTFCFDWC